MIQYKASFGSISSGTMRSEDLVPDFAWTLASLTKENRPEHIENLLSEAGAWEEQGDSDMSDDAESDWQEAGADLVNDLIDALNEYAPPYAYFGAHPGDGAAPELLASLERVSAELETLASTGDVQDFEKNGRNHLTDARDLLRRAKGE